MVEIQFIRFMESSESVIFICLPWFRQWISKWTALKGIFFKITLHLKDFLIAWNVLRKTAADEKQMSAKRHFSGFTFKSVDFFPRWRTICSHCLRDEMRVKSVAFYLNLLPPVTSFFSHPCLYLLYRKLCTAIIWNIPFNKANGS